MKSSGKSKSLGSGTKRSCSQDFSGPSLHITSITFENDSNQLGVLNTSHFYVKVA